MEELFFEQDLDAGSVVAVDGCLFEVMSYNEASDKFICRPMSDGIWLNRMQKRDSSFSVPVFKAIFQGDVWVKA